MERLDPITRGTDADYTIQLADRTGAALAGVYAGTEALSFAVWPGSGRLPMLAPYSSVAWLSAAAGTVRLRLGAADTAAWPAGIYSLSVLIRDGTTTVECYRATVEIAAAAGTEAAPKVYCTLDDCRRVCPWILDAVGPDPNVPDNLEPMRGMARAWYDGLIQRHWRGGMSLGAEAGLLARRRTGQRNMWLQQRLDAGALMVTPAVVTANANYALGQALLGLIGSRGKTTYQDLAADYFAIAEHWACTTTAELDTNADGTPDFAIDLGFIDVLRG